MVLKRNMCKAAWLSIAVAVLAAMLLTAYFMFGEKEQPAGKSDIEALVAVEGVLSLEQQEDLGERIKFYASKALMKEQVDLNLRVISIPAADSGVAAETIIKARNELFDQINNGEAVLVFSDEAIFQSIDRGDIFEELSINYAYSNYIEGKRFLIKNTAFANTGYLKQLSDDLGISLRTSESLYGRKMTQEQLRYYNSQKMVFSEIVHADAY